MENESTTRKIQVVSFCDGMSCGYVALKELNIPCKYHAVEINPKARKLSDNNFPGIIRFKNDLYNVCEEDIINLGRIDLFIAGTSCKTVSIAGNGDGLDGESGQIIKCVEILNWVLKHNPDCKWLLENVASMRGKHLKQFNKIIGREPIMIDAGLVSAQARKRLYWSNFNLQEPEDRKITFRSILGQEVIGLAWSQSSRYIDQLTGKVYSSPGPNRIRFVEQRNRIDGKANTLLTGEGCRGQSTCNFVIKMEKGKLTQRLLTLEECRKLQTIPDWYDFSSVSENVAFECLGNGWTVEVIKEFFSLLIPLFPKGE